MSRNNMCRQRRPIVRMKKKQKQQQQKTKKKKKKKTALHPWLSKMRPKKILIRLRKCAG